MDYPLITVGLICFNAEKSLIRAIQSIQTQGWPNLEIVIVDDVSTDGTWDLLQAHFKADQRARIYRNDVNSGAGKSRERVVEEAHGDFIAFFDDDDVSAPDRIEQQYKRIVDYENAYKPNLPVICHVSRKVCDETGQEWYFEALGCGDGVAPHGTALTDCLLLGKKTPNTSGNIGSCMLMARTESYRMIGNFDPEYRRAQDTEIVIRWARAGAHFVGIKEPLLTQMLTVTSRKVDLERKFVLQYLQKNADYLEQANMYDYIMLWTKSKYAFLSGNKFSGVLYLARAFINAPKETIQRAINARAFIKFNRMVSRRYDANRNTK